MLVVEVGLGTCAACLCVAYSKTILVSLGAVSQRDKKIRKFASKTKGTAPVLLKSVACCVVV